MKSFYYSLSSVLAVALALTLVGNCNKAPGTLVEREDHGFRAVFPGPVAERQQSVKTDSGEMNAVHFLHVRFEEQYELSINSLPDSLATKNQSDAVQSTTEHMIRRYRGAVESDRVIRSGGVEGRDITVRTGGGGLIRTKLFQKEGKLYIVTARVRGGEETEARAHRFVNSMELL
ncbi:MAG: hypothetical protein CMN76_04115 [Spirochaetaceae bacterium]|nr:hypothetical protein [Spirochaetaceae bacterium]|tara:strand:- start:285311 stop:285835 length:525 start_codon:yes stop_codon:yes gene_type:complete